MPHRNVRLHQSLVPVLIGVLIILQIFGPAPPILYLLCVLLGVSGISYYWAIQLRDNLDLERERRYGWAQVGDVIEERFSLGNAAGLPLLWAEVRDHSTLPGYSAMRVISAGARGQTRWNTEGFCSRRGVFTLGPLSIQTSDPLGFFSVQIEYPYLESFTVYPLVSYLPRIELPRGVSGGASQAKYPTHELTTDAASVRQYVPGDALNRIHWRSTARHGTIHVKEFDIRPSGDLWLILDLERAVQLGEGEQSTEEYAVTLAASLAYRVLQDNRAVGLIDFSDHKAMIRPARGQTQLWHILQTLANVSAGSDWPLDKILRQVAPTLGRGLTAAVITPSPDPAWLSGMLLLRHYGIAPMAILLDRASFGGEGDARTMAGLLAEQGIPSHIISRGHRFSPLAPRRRQRPLYKVLATGRVLVIPPEQASARDLAGEV